MKHLTITIFFGLAIVFGFGYGFYKLGYNTAQTFYLDQLAQTRREVEDAIRRSAQALAGLSENVKLGDERDNQTYQEIINAAPYPGDDCRIGLDGLRGLDAIAP